VLALEPAHPATPGTPKIKGISARGEAVAAA